MPALLSNCPSAACRDVDVRRPSLERLAGPAESSTRRPPRIRPCRSPPDRAGRGQLRRCSLTDRPVSRSVWIRRRRSQQRGRSRRADRTAPATRRSFRLARQRDVTIVRDIVRPGRRAENPDRHAVGKRRSRSGPGHSRSHEAVFASTHARRTAAGPPRERRESARRRVRKSAPRRAPHGGAPSAFRGRADKEGDVAASESDDRLGCREPRDGHYKTGTWTSRAPRPGSVSSASVGARTREASGRSGHSDAGTTTRHKQ
jgi:hypothetical protein